MPKDLDGLEERIQTRLAGGLVVDIHTPDLETRMAILRYKSEMMSVNISDDVIQYLATISNRSVRELEGNLNKVRMFSQLQGFKISIDMVKRVLNNHQNTPFLSTLTTETIENLVCHAFDLKIEDLKSKKRQKSVITARQIAMKLIQKHLNSTLKDIGYLFSKDHTTVLSHIKKIDLKLRDDTKLYKTFKNIESRIHDINKNHISTQTNRLV